MKSARLNPRTLSQRRPIPAGLALAAVLLATTACERLGARSGRNARVLDDLVTANRILAHEGIVDGYGHVSARSAEDPSRFFLSCAMAPGLVEAGDLLEYGLDGKPVRPSSREAYAERFIHAAIYAARPDVRAVVHCHTPSVIPFADSSVPLRPMYHMSAFLGAGVPIFEIRDVPDAAQMLVTDARTAQALAKTLGGAAVVLMRGHGAVVVGGSLSAAVSRSVYLDSNARMQAAAIALGGTVTYLEPADRQSSPEVVEGPDPYDRNWEYWKRRALDD